MGAEAVRGAGAGAASALVFTAVHDVLISDIWATLPVMLVAGALCGAALAWSHRRVVARPDARTWLAYNATLLGMFCALAVASVVVFEPVTTMAAVVAADAPPDELIAQALPMTLAFVPVAAAAIVALHGRRWSAVGPALVAVAVLVALLGLNVSVIGLVEIPAGSWLVVGELFLLLAVLDVVFALAHLGLARAGGRSEVTPVATRLGRS